jgi:hypothetical protein
MPKQRGGWKGKNPKPGSAKATPSNKKTSDDDEMYDEVGIS